MDSTREAWINSMLGRLMDTIGDERLGLGSYYGEAECRELLGRLYDMDVDATAGDLSPERRVLAWLIEMMGWDAMTAALLVRILDQLRWSRLEVDQPAASKLLGIDRTTLLKHRRNGRIRSKSEHYATDAMSSVIYWLPDILYTLAWRRQHPYAGGPRSAYPAAVRRA